MNTLKDDLLQWYPKNEWPCLIAQAEEWSRTKPLQGLKVLDTTPLFRNTLAKFRALILAGAELYVDSRGREFGDTAAHDRAVACGVKSRSAQDLKAMQDKGECMDIILDCMGVSSSLTPRFGYVELTKSGLAYYQHASRPVIVADSGRIKRIETSLGTSDGFFRALDYLGYGNRVGKKLVVVGCGKVGRGVIARAVAEGMQVFAIDVSADVKLPRSVELVQMSDRAAALQAMEAAWCVVTATGRLSVLENCIDLESLAASPALLANLGAEDEYGESMPADRVLNAKETLNFILEDPTRMPYIETTMALHNACALDLLAGDLPMGCHESRPDLEESLLEIVRQKGLLSEQEWAML